MGNYKSASIIVITAYGNNGIIIASSVDISVIINNGHRALLFMPLSVMAVITLLSIMAIALLLPLSIMAIRTRLSQLSKMATEGRWIRRGLKDADGRNIRRPALVSTI